MRPSSEDDVLSHECHDFVVSTFKDAEVHRSSVHGLELNRGDAEHRAQHLAPRLLPHAVAERSSDHRVYLLRVPFLQTILVVEERAQMEVPGYVAAHEEDPRLP